VAKLVSKPSIMARILLAKALALLSEHHPPHIAWEKLVHGMATEGERGVPYWPDDPDLAALWRKLSGKSGKNDPQIQHIRCEESWVEFYINNVRRTIYPIQVGLEGVWRLLPKDVRARLAEREEEPVKEEPRHILAVDWITSEARQLKRTGKIPVDIERGKRGAKKEFAQLLATNMIKAAKTDRSIHPVTWKYIRNHLLAWRLWPTSVIE